ncbi:MAG: hypothetical protein ABGW87_07545 [Sphingomonadaceae bacterium]
MAVDFSAILILPYSVVVAISALVVALIFRREAPRLIWPFLFSFLTASAVFIGMPQASEVGYWIAFALGLSLWAAFGTVIGAGVVKLTRATIRVFQGK